MRKIKLKEMFIVRNANDFRIFCQTKNDAIKTKIAIMQWLSEQLKLEVSKEKTRIVNVKRRYSDFLGFKIKVHPKGKTTSGNYTTIPIAGLQTVYANVGAHIGRILTPEDMANINEIYLRVTRNDFSVGFGSVSLTGGSNGTHGLINDLTANDESPAPTGEYSNPIPGDWRGLVSCEFGTGYAGHTGMDLAIPVGTELRAVADGTVLFTRASTTGYGVHVAVNHGGGVVTLYAHCSRILVGEGQKVTKGQAIALSGDTGNSTGPHLHLEFVIDGVPYNPRPYL